MRIAASIIGIVGALCGIFFAQLIVSVGMMLAIVTTATQGSELDLGTEFYIGLAALVLYAIGVAGGVAVVTRPIVGGALFLVSAIGSLVATIAINGAPSMETGGTLVANTFPYVGPVLLFFATALTAFGLRAQLMARAASAQVTAAAPEVAPSRAELASAVPMRLLAEPAANASSMREIEPGTAFDSMEQSGEFVHVRGSDFDGFLPAWSVRKVA